MLGTYTLAVLDPATVSGVWCTNNDQTFTEWCMAAMPRSYNELAGLPRVGIAALCFGKMFVTDTSPTR
jgi:hypothetical protein